MIFLNKDKKGFGWHTAVSREDIGMEKPLYINYSFKKGCDPIDGELNEKGSIAGELILKTQMGYRKLFPVITEYNGTTHLELKILELTDEPSPFRPKQERQQEPFGNLKIEESDLPFY